MLPARLFFLKILFFFIFQPEKKPNNIISVSHTVGFCFAFFFFLPGGLCSHCILLFHTCKKTQGQVQGVFLG